MKKVLSVFALLVGISAMTLAQVDTKNVIKDVPKATEVKDANGPKMEFKSLEVDYGTIEQGSDPYRVFAFTNTGTEPLIITNAQGSCGCTVPTYPKEPILPGQAGEIKVRYDTNRPGPFTKRVTLTTNVGNNEQVILTIKGKVEKKAEDPSGLPQNSGGLFNNNN